jgi:hypothetical protein
MSSNFYNEVTFITINYNSADYTIKLLQSIQKFTRVKYEVIVVDNNSKEDDLNKLKDFIANETLVKLICNPSNDGFATGNMLGVSYANSKYYFFINNDTQLLNDAALIMMNYLDTHSSIALSTGKVKNEKGSFSSSYKLFPSLSKELFGNSVARKLTKHNFPSNKIKLEKPTLVEVVSGSCMFFRADDFNSIGGFDKDFFLYCEEEDISKRVWNNKKEVVFLPDAEIIHYSGGSTQKSFEIEREYYISYHLLLKKHFGLFSRTVLRGLLLFKLFRRSFKRENAKALLICALSSCPKLLSLRLSQKGK